MWCLPQLSRVFHPCLLVDRLSVRVPVPASVRSFAPASRTRAGGTDPAAPLVRAVGEEPRGSRTARPALREIVA